MSSVSKKKTGIEYVILGILGIGLGGSIVATFMGSNSSPIDARSSIESNDAVALVFPALENSVRSARGPKREDSEKRGLMVGEFRVVAIGSAYPIPYEAEICPFSGIPQPTLNQLDRDGDEITDDWELKYDLNKYNATDAQEDPDEDGFNNLEEFKGSTNPRSADSHPPYATKLRFVERKDIPFFLVFQGFTELGDGSVVFQLNKPETGKTHFASLNENVEGVVVQRFEASKNGSPARLFVRRGSSEIELVRGEIALDPKSKAELINILDQTPILVTMGALLSLRNDEYTVLGVYPDKVILRDIQTGNVFEIVGLADGKQ
ncbi:hypothetical protein P4C99_01210 [Pontiellaceae bacterium B1224]|nr:hypothetical protein [Pontiellaceae bacterium B1224]